MSARIKATKAYATIKEMVDITVRRYPCRAADSPFYGMGGKI